MKYLSNNCRRSEIKVTPSNWHTKKASLRKDWYVWYRFYDPEHSARYPTGKLVPIKGMNHLKDLQARQAVTKKIIEEEAALLDQQGYNPITDQFMLPAEVVVEEEPEGQPAPETDTVTPETGLVSALQFALKQSKAKSLPQLKSMLTYLTPSAVKLGLDQKPISEVRRRDIKTLLDQVGRDKLATVKKLKNGKLQQGRWTANTYNHYLGHLGMLFVVLDEYEVFDISPTAKLKKKEYARPPRKVAGDDEFMKVDSVLRTKDYYFWRFLKMFQQSGARLVEFLGVHEHRVNLNNRTFSVLVEKGKMRYEEKYIDDEVLPLWREIMAEVAFLQKSSGTKRYFIYLFGVNLQPQIRPKPLLSDYATKRWLKVKKKYGIDEDLYARKHRRTTKDVDDFIEKTIEKAQRKAARKNSHNAKMVSQVYDVKNKKRRVELRMRLAGRQIL